MIRLTESGKSKHEFGFGINSSREEDEKGNTIHLHMFGRYWYWRTGFEMLKSHLHDCGGYCEIMPVEYSFKYHTRHSPDMQSMVFIYYGMQDQYQWPARHGRFGGSIIFTLPWREWVFSHHEILNLDKSLFKLLGKREFASEVDGIPMVRFLFRDGYDGAEITCTAYIERRTWEKGSGWFSWMKKVCKPLVITSMCLDFDKEVGSEKGSWKGGTLGHSCDIEGGQSPEDAFKAYCAKEGHEYVRIFAGDEDV